MRVDPRTPVLVGAAAVMQREADPAAALEPVALMAEAARRAATDAGCPALLDRLTSIRIPRGFWDYPDPGRLLAADFGATRARTQVAEIGVLQTTPFGLAAEAIGRGDDEVVLICGAEARHRARQAKRAGVEPATRPQAADVLPDEVLRPEREIIAEAEIQHGLVMPVAQYAVMENALRFAEGQTLSAHREAVARLWAGFSDVAATNPDAWSRSIVPAATIAAAGAENPMLAFPYGKLHTSQWNVDQEAALLLCSVETARALGVSSDRWVFPVVVADSNHMLPVSERPDLHRAPGFEFAGRAALAHAAIDIDDVQHLELYSCFPVAVRAQARALGLGEQHRPLTLTGGMPFAGGPLNNFALQAMVKAAAVLRASPGSRALVTAVSGMLTKQGLSLWASAPPPRPFRFLDVTADVAATSVAVPAAPAHRGAATVASYTVVHEIDGSRRGILVCDTPEGRRTVASTRDPTLTDAMEHTEWCGRRVDIGPDGVHAA
jgi:acetyl-CoA C-acetyltransferase